jgi:hypothetical protein
MPTSHTPDPSPASGARRLAGLVATTVVAAGLALVAAAMPASAGTIAVTTTADVLAADGQTSLREAVNQAEATAGLDSVVLAADQTYQLTLCAADNGNTGDSTDLDHVTGGSLVIEGDGSTIQQTCLGERIIEHDPGAPTGGLTLRDLTITGAQIQPSAAVLVDEDVVFERVHAVDNIANAVVLQLGGDEATFVDSVFDGSPFGQSAISTDADVVTIENTTVRDYLQYGVLADLGSDVDVTDSRFLDNGHDNGPVVGALGTYGPTRISGSTFVGNQGVAGAILVQDSSLEVDTSTFAGNRSHGDGAAITVRDTDANPLDNQTRLEHTTVYDNARVEGGTSNLFLQGPLTAFATMVGQPQAGASCSVFSTISEGFNLESGSSCQFTGSDDVDGLSSLGLGALSPGDDVDELVLVPQFPSLAVDLVGNGDCVGTIVDQIGQLRPLDGDFDGDGECDSGAVERPLGPAFTDVGTSHPFYEEVSWMGWQGISTGSQPGPVYKPSDPVSRQAMSAFMYRLADASFAGGPPSFSDVSPSNPFFDEIQWMDAEGIATGYPDGTFRPLAPVTRQAMSAFMHRLAGEPQGPFPDPGFTDVGPGNGFVLAISWMADSGISEGYEDGTFRPSLPVSRQAMAAFMYRFAQLAP